jgi:phage terminase large subunit GpA-like protein
MICRLTTKKATMATAAISTADAPRGRAIDRITGARTAIRRERELRRQIFHPPSKLTLSEWADKYRYISDVASAEPGKWRTSRAPFQRGMMDAISDRGVQRVVIVGGSQWGKSEKLINTAFYFIHQEPSPILMVRPSLEDARDFSEDRIKSNAECTPEIKKRLKSSSGRRSSGDKMLRKAFNGGHLTLVGANSATGLANRPIRVVLFDEVDKYPRSAGDKGDPIALAENRTQTFRHRKKIVLVSTPGVKGVSKIWPEWERSDQRKFFVPCPHCHHFQVLVWKRGDDYAITRDDFTYTCEGCAGSIEERHKPWMLEQGEWRVTNPDGAFPGFHISALYSPWVKWRELVERFLIAKQDLEKLQAFVNEALAELWDPQDGDGIDAQGLTARRERYPAEVPAGVGVLTAFVDVQRDWMELAVKGWGTGQESWLIAHHRIRGNTEHDDPWNRLDPLLLKGYQHESGATLYITICGVDSGDGDNVTPVYRFVAPRQKRARCPVRATKGSSIRGRPVIAARASKPNKYGVRVHHVGTDTAKDIIFPRLRLKRSEDGSIPPGYMHFPQPFADGGCDDEYLEQFAREKVFPRYDHGVRYRSYEVVPAGARNEAIDLEVGNLRMLHELGAGVYDQLSVWVKRVNDQGAKVRSQTDAPVAGITPTVETTTEPAAEDTATVTPAVPVAAAPVPHRPPPRRPGGGWVNSWRR